MKNLQTTTSLIALLALCTGCKDTFSKLSEPQHTTTVSVLGDVSDPGLMDEPPAEIVKLFPLGDDHLYEGLVFRSRVISESDDHDVSEFVVKPVGWWEGNPNFRVYEFRDFERHVTKALEHMEKEEVTTKRNSLVYEAFVKEATTLSHSKSDRKVLICMSDMLQSSDEISFYKSSDLLQAKNNPKAVIARFQKIAPLPHLNGVSIYFLHRCRSYQEQKRYDVAVNIFVKMATEAGAAEIHVGPNIVAHE
jgi:hypothetical protein